MPKQKHKAFKDFWKFLLVLSVLVAYCIFAIYSYGIKQGLSVTALTWSFFVFCTPIADAGVLVDFPTRLITGFRMVYSEMLVWLTATILNVTFFTFDPGIYQKTELLKLFHEIITTPWPLGFIIVLSAIGTFASILFDDNIYDAAAARAHHIHINPRKAKRYLTIGIFVLTIVLYIVLLNITHTHIKIF